jgi:hypothetical protein
MEIIVVTYGKGEIGDRYSVMSFNEKQDALNFCRIINKLELKDDAWIRAQLVNQNTIYPINPPLTFDILLSLDDRATQKMLREVDSSDLAKALKGASVEIKEKIFRNMSKRAAVMIQEDIEYMGRIPLDDITVAKKKIVGILEDLAEREEIIPLPDNELSPPEEHHETNLDDDDDLELDLK